MGKEKFIQEKYKKNYSNLDARFLFVNSGYNLRPTEIQAAIASSQFKRKNIFKNNRKYNRELIIRTVLKNKNYTGQINFLKVEKNIQPSWFGLAIIIDKKFIGRKKKYLEYLSKKGIETRPIISGNFINQPAIKLYGLNKKKYNFKNAQIIENQGFFIGLHTQKISNKLVEYVSKNLLKINEN